MRYFLFSLNNTGGASHAIFHRQESQIDKNRNCVHKSTSTAAVVKAQIQLFPSGAKTKVVGPHYKPIFLWAYNHSRPNKNIIKMTCRGTIVSCDACNSWCYWSASASASVISHQSSDISHQSSVISQKSSPTSHQSSASVFQSSKVVHQVESLALPHCLG